MSGARLRVACLVLCNRFGAVGAGSAFVASPFMRLHLPPCLQAAALWHAVSCHMLALAHAMEEAASSACMHDAPHSLPEQLRQAAQRLQNWISESEGSNILQEITQLLQSGAALMQQYQALPAVETERQLALAQAAAGRSCAYLRCANLGSEGGPAAGQGAGSMRCRWAHEAVAVDRTWKVLGCPPDVRL